MRLPLTALLVIVIIGGLMVWYLWRRMKRYNTNRSVAISITALAAAGMAVPVALMFMPVKDAGEGRFAAIMWLLFCFLSVFISLGMFILFDLLGRIRFGKKKKKGRGSRSRKPSRTATVMTCIGAGVGATIFLAMWWGALFGRYRIDVKPVDVEIAELPESFDGLVVAQISDLHTGTFGSDTTFVSRLVDSILTHKPDVIVFTGDIVNRSAEELEPFTEVLARLHAPYGVYSIMGNHDYGDYHSWADPADKEADIANLKRMQRQMGWEMLNNSHAMLRRGADSLVLIGVENVGDPPFTVYGDLEAAYPTLDDGATKILLTHNPAHWENDIKDSPDKNIALTLSGHTHAMQIRVFGLSPSAWRYRYWGGLYEDEDNHKLYVNIGDGCVGFPARIGATPEITLLKLKRID